MRKDFNIKVSKAYRTPFSYDRKLPITHHSQNLQCPKKDRILKSHKGKPIRVTADFSRQTLKVRRDQSEAY